VCTWKDFVCLLSVLCFPFACSLSSPYLHPAVSLPIKQAKQHHFSHKTGAGRRLFQGPHSLSLGRRGH